jgi:hypothetical protein
MAADFLVAIASSALGTKFFVPPLPLGLALHAAAFFQRLPPISAINRYQTDKELCDALGNEFFEILRYILFTNRCHLIHLPPELAIGECAQATEQFLWVMAWIITQQMALNFAYGAPGSGQNQRRNTWRSLVRRWDLPIKCERCFLDVCKRRG